MQGNNRVLRFEPASSTHSVAFNPLDEIRLGTDHETGDMQNLATLIVDPDGKGLHTHWRRFARGYRRRGREEAIKQSAGAEPLPERIRKFWEHRWMDKDYPRFDLGFAKLCTTARSSAGSTGFGRWF